MRGMDIQRQDGAFPAMEAVCNLRVPLTRISLKYVN